MVTQTLIGKDLSEVIEQLTKCAIICEASVSALEETDPQEFEKVISITHDCAVTCRRAIIIIEDGRSSAAGFLEVCKEICQACEKKNRSYSNNEYCVKTINACRDCVAYLNAA